jgi:hypothetical protein
MSCIAQESKFLKTNGFKALKIDCTNESISQDIKKYGSILFSKDTIGAHQMIVDEVNEKDKYAVVRDPFHGWSIRIKLDYFKNTLFKKDCYYLDTL